MFYSNHTLTDITKQKDSSKTKFATVLSLNLN